MTTKLSNGAVQLLDVITKMPGHFREDYMTTAGIKRAMWNRLSGELRRTGNAYAERTTIDRNGKQITDFKWYAGSKTTGKSRARKTSKKPPAVRRGTARATTRTKTEKSPTTETVKPEKLMAAKPEAKTDKKFSSWTPEELEMLHDLWKQGLSDKQIEAKIGRTSWAIRGKRKTQRWVAKRGDNKPQKVTKTRKSEEPTYKVTMHEPPQPEVAEDKNNIRVAADPYMRSNALTPAFAGLDVAITELILKAQKQNYSYMRKRFMDIEKRLSILEDSLSENSEADQVTINVIGELEKTLSALKGNL
jgi:hypothetical protein